MTEDGKPMEGLTKTGCSTCGTSCQAPGPVSEKKEKRGRVMAILLHHRRLLSSQVREFETKADEASRLSEMRQCLCEIDQVLKMLAELDDMSTCILSLDGKRSLQAMIMALNVAIYAGVHHTKLTCLVDQLRQNVVVEDCQKLMR
jgi:hypothetical protein